MKLEIANFTKALDGKNFDKWNLFNIDESDSIYEFRARNKPHSQKADNDCIAILVIIGRYSNEAGKYKVEIAYKEYSNCIYSEYLTKEQIKSKVEFFRHLTSVIDKYENK
jgi:hypothetical protein